MHEVTREGVTHIVCNLRPRDRAEIFALRWDDSEAQLIADVTRMAGPLWKIWSWDHEPVAINGVILSRPGVAQACAFGAEKWRFTLRDMTRWSREWVIPALQAANYHRGEAYVLAANVDARKWIEALGGEIEAYLHQYGRNCEDFILYTWRLNDVSRWRRGRRRGTAVLACRVRG
jgi:hypothetical protein